MPIPIVFRILTLAFVVSACTQSHEKFIDPDYGSCIRREINNEYMIKYKSKAQVQRLLMSRAELHKLLDAPDVEWAEPNYRLEHEIPETEISIGWNDWPLIGAEYAWARGYVGQGIKVAVVDSGIDTRHPMLKKALRRGSDERLYSTEENGVDEDGNGFIDDLYGWNFADNSQKIEDETGHGTHIAGVISAAHSSMTSFRGLAPEAGLIAADFMNSESGDEFNAIRAVDYSIKRGAQVINNSWSNFCSHSLREAFESWQSLNVIFINAAGNDGLQIDALAIFPANLSLANAVTVGSMGHSGKRSLFSNYGRNVFAYAPGEDIYSLSVSTSGFNHLVARSGTSMAAAFASGAVALVWSAHPEKTAAEIVSTIRNRQAQLLDVRDLFHALD